MFFNKNIRSRSTARETKVFCQSALKEYMSFMKEQIRNKKKTMETEDHGHGNRSISVLVAMKWMFFYEQIIMDQYVFILVYFYRL